MDKIGLFKKIALKGGTAIRKLYSGKQGRFSIDLDFTTTSTSIPINDIEKEFIEAVDGLEIEDFKYNTSYRRNRYYVGLTSKFSKEEILKTKLDFAAPAWIITSSKLPVSMQIHKQYGQKLPKINTIKLEENIAEKIARLNRTTTARDLYDLKWLIQNSKIKSNLDLNLIRRLVVLKIWVDSHGLNCENAHWNKAHQPSSFDPQYWLRNRKEEELDLEDIGALSIPVPSAKELLSSVQQNYQFLNNLDNTEAQIAKSNAKDRSLVIKTLKKLPNNIFADKPIY